MGKLKRKMCEGCGLKQANYGLASEAKRRWCAGCMKAKEAVPLATDPHAQAAGSTRGVARSKECEDCELKPPRFGLASEGRKRWCAGCVKAHPGALLVVQKKKLQKMCEGAGGSPPQKLEAADPPLTISDVLNHHVFGVQRSPGGGESS